MRPRPEKGRLEVTVYLAGADMGDPDMNAIIADPIWFDVVEFPRAKFQSNSIEKTGPETFVARGVLDLKGIQKRVEVPFNWSEWGNSAQMSGNFALRRIDFDVGSGEWATGDAIGLDVALKFAILLESSY